MESGGQAANLDKTHFRHLDRYVLLDRASGPLADDAPLHRIRLRALYPSQRAVTLAAGFRSACTPSQAQSSACM